MSLWVDDTWKEGLGQEALRQVGKLEQKVADFESTEKDRVFRVESLQAALDSVKLKLEV